MAGTKEQAKELRRMIRIGDVFGVESFFAAGNYPNVWLKGRNAALNYALDYDCLSMVEVIAKYTQAQAAKNAALAKAVDRYKKYALTFAKPLVKHGADVRSVPFEDVLRSGQPELMQFFLDNGADPLTGWPFAYGLAEQIWSVQGIFVAYRQAHPEHAAALQAQLDCALRYYCRDDRDEKPSLVTIGRLVKTGADCRSRGPMPKDSDTEDPDLFTTALEQACRSGSLEVVEKFKPDSARDDLACLLQCAVGSTMVLALFLSLGASPNDKENGGSSAMDRCWDEMEYEAWRAIGCAEVLAKHGAVWRPDEPPWLHHYRRVLLKCQPRDATQMFRTVLRNEGSWTKQLLKDIIRTPAMKQHLRSQEDALWGMGLRRKPKYDDPGVVETYPPRNAGLTWAMKYRGKGYGTPPWKR